MKCFLCHKGSYDKIDELGEHLMGAHGDMFGELIASFTQVRWAPEVKPVDQGV